MKVTCLVDNISEKDGVGCEHGLSLYIETEGHKLLFDLGKNSLFAANALTLKADISSVDTVIISHGHYDHGGGLKTLFNINSKAKIYIKKEAFGDYYAARSSGITYIGLDKACMQNGNIVFTGNHTRVDEELELFSITDISDERPSLNKKLKTKLDDIYYEDDFVHEQNLIIKSNGKNILIAGCAHNGITNIIRRFIELEKVAPDYVISGFHLSGSNGGEAEDQAVIVRLGEKLSQWHTKYYTCHCTGIEPYKKLKRILNDKIEYLAAGDILKI